MSFSSHSRSRVTAVAVAEARVTQVRVGVRMGGARRVTRIQAQVVQSVLQSAAVAGLPGLAQVTSLVPARGSATVLVAAHFLRMEEGTVRAQMDFRSEFNKTLPDD